MTPKGTTNKIQQAARLAWVPLNKIKVNELAQRDLRQARVDHLAANLDLDQIGNPIVSHRDGYYWVIDGQHRVEALRQFGFTDEPIQCWSYEGLTSQDEAEMFLKRNDALPINAFERFTKAVHAGRSVESDIDRIVRSVGCVVSQDKGRTGAIGAVAALRKVYALGPGVLARTLVIIRDAFGDGGYENVIINGLGQLVARYESDLDDKDLIAKLARIQRGSKGLLQKAEVLHRTTGTAKTQCVAAAAVEAANGMRGGKKLPSWWKQAA